jgi:hypothetical protein
MPIVTGSISYAPFPEGFQGDTDEVFQQSGQLATIYLEGSFLVGQYIPPGSSWNPVTATTDQGPINYGARWYFFDPVRTQYEAQAPVVPYGVDTTNNTSYAVTVNVLVALTQGTVIFVLPSLTNAINPTLNVNSLGAKNIVTKGGATLAASVLTANTLFGVIYDGTAWRLFTQ